MSFYWFDYETFGVHPAYDRPSQFAGIRTDDALNPIGDPLVIYCRPGNDYFPTPEACMITGITPQLTLEKGLPEPKFIDAIRQQLLEPGTCGVGYNNIRFDDEFTRHILFRNFYDPYEHEWKNGNSRWDMLDIVRLTRALRPEGIIWPKNADGTNNNKLEEIAKLNGIEHVHAHDALSDVYATIAVAKLLREKKTRLFDFALQHKDKNSVATLLNLVDKKPVLHVSGMIPGKYMHTAVVMPLGKHPSNKNGVLVYDLRFDPDEFLELDSDELALRLFSPAHELPIGMTRLPVKTVHINRCPVLVPTSTLDEASRERTDISLEQSAIYAQKLQNSTEFLERLQSAFSEHSFDDPVDIDGSLYAGGFFTQSDKRAFERIHITKAQDLGSLELFHDDSRVPEMLFRYRARNYPDTLNAVEKSEWEDFRIERLTTNGRATAYFSHLESLKGKHPEHLDLLTKLAEYAKSLLPE